MEKGFWMEEGLRGKRRRVFRSVGGLLCGDLFFTCCDAAGQRF
jgi:hypothetical protein